VRALPDAEPGRRDRRLDAWANHLVGGIPEVVRLTDLYQSYIFLEDPDNALRLAERCVMLQGSADAYVNRAVAKALLAEPDYKGAILDLDKGVATDPTFGRAYYVRAMIHREEGRVDQAAADSAKAKELGFDEEGGGGDPNDASE